MNNYNNKHLSLEDRILIEEGIAKRLRKYQIAESIEKSPSTVAKEIKKHRKIKVRNTFNNPFNCTYWNSCKVCYKKCKKFKEQTCLNRERFIGACNSCPNLSTCKLDKYFYNAKVAHDNYLYSLRDSREGVNLLYPELKQIATIITPLINKGQSLYQIVTNHKELNLSVKTLYNYIEIGLLNEWGINNLSLKRKCKRRNKSKKLKKRNEPINYAGRKYEDYLNFIKINPTTPTTEMDTVYNNEQGPYIQTFIFEHTSFMIGILHREKTSVSMSNAITLLQENLGTDFNKLFSLLLTDRGSEFQKSELFEINVQTGESRCNIFYCDAQTPSQKPHVENNHNFIREILPNGMDWYDLTQDKVDLMFSHINSVPRENLGGKTAYEAFCFFYGEELAKKLNIQKIEKDKVTLKPYLLKIK